LINLIFNSVDALPRGGHIELGAKLQPWAGDSSSASGRRIVLEVRDDGTGMDDETRRRCLEPFFTTKAQRGTGLGLAMVYGMMQRHEGAVEIDSAPNSGTTVRLVFPEKRPSAPAAPDTAAPTSAQSGRPLRILCIDDEPKLRDLLAACLGTFGHSVAVAGSGRDGLSMFRDALANRQPYELVVTDLGMPELDGHQVAKEIKAHAPGTPVVMMTGWGEPPSATSGTSATVDAVLGKPPKLEELVETIRRLAS
jgi:CheY-like chemotaxis protein